jgi:hypothetical protein
VLRHRYQHRILRRAAARAARRLRSARVGGFQNAEILRMAENILCCDYSSLHAISPICFLSCAPLLLFLRCFVYATNAIALLHLNKVHI